jgi:simple sugar transport system permease protein
MGAALLVCMACGATNGLLVARLGVQPIIATLILMVAGRGIAQRVGQKVLVDSEHTGFLFIGNGHLFGLPFTITLALVVLLVTALLMRGTALGLFVESVGNNPVASRYAGLRLRSIVFYVYVFSGLCAAIAGLIGTSDIRQSDAINAGLYLELDAILAVVVGGTALTGGRFFLIGSVIGALLILTLEITIISQDVQAEYALIVKALVVLAVCLLQSPDFRRRLIRGRASA